MNAYVLTFLYAIHLSKVNIFTLRDATKIRIGYLHLPYPHYSDVIMSAMASQITGVSVVYSTVCSGSDQRKHQSSASLVVVRGIHRSPVNSPHKGPVTREMFPFTNVIMHWGLVTHICVRELHRHWHVRRQDITWTNVDFSWIGFLEERWSAHRNTKLFIQRNVFADASTNWPLSYAVNKFPAL